MQKAMQYNYFCDESFIKEALFVYKKRDFQADVNLETTELKTEIEERLQDLKIFIASIGTDLMPVIEKALSLLENYPNQEKISRPIEGINSLKVIFGENTGEQKAEGIQENIRTFDIPTNIPSDKNTIELQKNYFINEVLEKNLSNTENNNGIVHQINFAFFLFAELTRINSVECENAFSVLNTLYQEKIKPKIRILCAFIADYERRKKDFLSGNSDIEDLPLITNFSTEYRIQKIQEEAQQLSEKSDKQSLQAKQDELTRMAGELSATQEAIPTIKHIFGVIKDIDSLVEDVELQEVKKLCRMITNINPDDFRSFTKESPEVVAITMLTDHTEENMDKILEKISNVLTAEEWGAFMESLNSIDGLLDGKKIIPNSEVFDEKDIKNLISEILGKFEMSLEGQKVLVH